MGKQSLHVFSHWLPRAALERSNRYIFSAFAHLSLARGRYNVLIRGQRRASHN